MHALSVLVVYRYVWELHSCLAEKAVYRAKALYTACDGPAHTYIIMGSVCKAYQQVFEGNTHSKSRCFLWILNRELL